MSDSVLSTGKAKTLYTTNDPKTVLIEFRDDTSAFDGKKTSKLANKGAVNNQFNAFVMQKLESEGVKTHFLELMSETKSLCRRLDMIPIECVVRNVAAGSICRRLGIDSGIDLDPPTFEFFLKNDELGDPMINEYHIRSFAWATDTDVARMKELTFRVNDILKAMFSEKGMILVDYKLEFGRFEDEIYLGDEFTPDGCRIWDAKTREKLDKDRFRQDLGDVVEAYEIVAQRLGVDLRKSN